MQKPENIDYKKLLKLLNSVLDNASDMLDNITQILELSKITSNKLSYTKESFNLNAMLTHLIKKFDSLVKSKNIKLNFTTEKDFLVYSDKYRVQQIITNILSNAIKYTNDEIVITITSHNNFTKISIEDNGNGIKNKDSIFELYNQENSTHLNRNEEGTGIGSVLCKDYL